MAGSAETRFSVLFFTDIVGSTDLKARHGVPAYREVLGTHNGHFERLARECRGIRILQNMGDGYFAEGDSVAEVVKFALLFQDAMRVGPWGEIPLTTRVGIHAGEVTALASEGGSGIVAPAADLAARVMSLAVGGQILLTRFPFDETRHFLREHPPIAGKAMPPLQWLAHGPYLLKGRDEPMEIFEVGADGLAPFTAPPDGEKAKRAIRPGEEETLGWRPAVGLEIPGRTGWHLAERLGAGGFGEVWAGEHAKLRQRRAFKFCFDDERLRALKREVTLVRLLRNALGERDDIVHIHELKLDAPPFYLESDLAPHGNLLQWAEQQGGLEKISLVQRIALVAHTATALAAAHSIGVLHKDIKPTNILIFDASDGTARPRLVDFGIGTLADPSILAQQGITGAGFTRMTIQHSTGTPTYSPPEYLAGKPYTIQGDIYGLGVLLYQLVTVRPFDPLAPGWERDIADPLLREDIAACVDGEPARRLASAAELAERLCSLDQRRAARAAEHQRAAINARRKRNSRLALIVSAVTAVVAVALGAGYFRERDLRQRATQAEERRLTGERQRLADRKQFAPALVEAARLLMARRDFDAARVSVEQAVEYDPALVSALGLKAALLVEREDFAGAAVVLESPTSKDATLVKLKDFCRAAGSGQRPDLKTLGGIFEELGLHSLAESCFTRAGARVEAALATIEAAWPKSASGATVLPSGKLRVDLSSRSDVADLAPLSGLPIEVLNLSKTRIKDLTPLKGMALREIDLEFTGVSDLSPLSGMPLTRVSIQDTLAVRDLTPLSDAPLTHINLQGSAVTDLAPLRKAPLTILQLVGCRIGTLETLRGKPLTDLQVSRTGISNLAALAGMPLTSLDISGNPVDDLAPLAGLKLSGLTMSDTPVRDISVLRGMPLKYLDIARTKVVDVSPLAEAPIEDALTLSPELIQSGMDLLRANSRIKGFRVRSVQTMTPEEFWKRYDARYFDSF